MSAMLATRTRTTLPIKPVEPVEEMENGQSRHSPMLKHGGPDAEAPEEAIREEEGPESWQEWNTEAPDAGRGEAFEREFTHGRSRS
jgi:hypothetical protein